MFVRYPGAAPTLLLSAPTRDEAVRAAHGYAARYAWRLDDDLLGEGVVIGRDAANDPSRADPDMEHTGHRSGGHRRGARRGWLPLARRAERYARQLGADTTRWRIADVRLYRQVDYDEQAARIDPGTPCQFVRDTAIHEWVHLQHARRYGGSGGVYARYGSWDEAERVADCAARALGSDTTPYVDPSWGSNYIGPCTDADEAGVRRLITYRSGGR